MKIKDIIKNSAVFLGLERVITSIENLTEENEMEILKSEEMSKLFNIIKLSIQDLCSHYLTVRVTEQIEVTNKFYEVKNLANLIRVEKVFKGEESVNFKIVNRSIIFEDNGIYNVQFLAYPEIKSLNDDLDYFENFDMQVLVYSVCAYYSISIGAFEEFDYFHKMFEESVEKLKELKVFTIPARRWE